MNIPEKMSSAKQRPFCPGKDKLMNNAMGPKEINNMEIYRLKFILKRHVFVLHMTSAVTGSKQVTHRAVGTRTMHGFGTDLVRIPAIWLVDSRNYVN